MTSQDDTNTVSASVVLLIPTRNESSNIAEFLHRLSVGVAGLPVSFAAVLADDSDDDTIAVARASCPEGLRLHPIYRPPELRRGTISGALLYGLKFVSADVVVVIDADLQHPPELLATLIEPLLSDTSGVQITVGTRYVEGGSAAGLTTPWRRLASRLASAAIHLLFPRTRGVTDPASGYFGYRTECVEGVELNPVGFKLLTEILVRSRAQRIGEVPYRFQERSGGLSKFSILDGVDFLRHLLRLRRSVGGRSQPRLEVQNLIGLSADQVPIPPADHR